VPASGRRAAQDGWNPHQEPFQTEKAAQHGKMTKHGHFTEIAESWTASLEYLRTPNNPGVGSLKGH
jgi:hypothetical protein